MNGLRVRFVHAPFIEAYLVFEDEGPESIRIQQNTRPEGDTSFAF